MESIRKRLVALSLSAMMLLQFPFVGSADESKGVLGDVTGDGIVDTYDALVVLRYSCGLEELTSEQLTLADFDNSGEVDSQDSLYIQRYSVGIQDNFNNISRNNASTTNNTKIDSDKISKAYNGYGDNAVEDTSINVSGTSYNLPVGMTLYVTSTPSVAWGSNNTEIATVDGNGLVLAKNVGTVKIIALSGNRKRTINVNVIPAEPVRGAYTSPNSASKGSTVKLLAITDQTRSDVRFDVNINGEIHSVKASEKTADNDHGIYTWTGYITADTSGTFDVTVSAKSGDSWTSCDKGKTTMFVSSSSSQSETALNTLRASDDIINLISQYEGCLEKAEIDPIAYGRVMNYGFGHVIYGGETFYNNASRGEYFSDLVNEVNEKIYSKYVNEYLQSNGIKYNQHQFDSLVSFVYNLGVYSLQNAGLSSILNNCYEPAGSTDSDKSDSLIATVNVSGYLNFRSGAGTNYSVIGKFNNGDKVTVVDSNRVNGVWVKVKDSKGLVGYCSSDYLIFGSSSSGSKNFDYINKQSLIQEVLAWHHAGGVCYYGLLYRRIDELEVFLYADYSQDGYLNKYGWTYPGCIR